MNGAGPDPRRGPGPAFFRRPALVASGVVVFVAVAGTFAATWLVQRFVTFPPPKGLRNPDIVIEQRGERLWLDVGGDRVEAWYLPPRHAPARTPLLIYSHGNVELIDNRAAEFGSLRDAGLGILLVEYPGYGRSEGYPSEASVTAALVAGFDWAARDPRIDAGRIAGYGRSLGGGAIAQLAAHRPLAALVLESTFENFADVVSGFGVPRPLLINHFNTRAVLERYPGAVLLLHGTLDRTFDSRNAHALAAVARRATLHLAVCGHADCPRQWELVRSFLARNGVLSTQDRRQP
jgi:hypothetical protein